MGHFFSNLYWKELLSLTNSSTNFKIKNIDEDIIITEKLNLNNKEYIDSFDKFARSVLKKQTCPIGTK